MHEYRVSIECCNVPDLSGASNPYNIRPMFETLGHKETVVYIYVLLENNF